MGVKGVDVVKLLGGTIIYLPVIFFVSCEILTFGLESTLRSLGLGWKQETNSCFVKVHCFVDPSIHHHLLSMWTLLLYTNLNLSLLPSKLLH